jgi:hypothetical protein
MSTTMAVVMDGLAALITTVPNVYAWPVESVTVPCVLVDYPVQDLDLVMGGAADTWDVPVLYIVGTSSTKDARDNLSATVPILRAALNGGHAFGDVRVTKAEIIPVTVGAVTYLGAKLNCEVIG